MYLKSIDYEIFSSTKKIVKYEHGNKFGKEYLIIELEESISGYEYGYANKELKKIFLLSRFNDKELKKLNKFPIHVHVIIPENGDDIESIKPWNEMNNVAWALLYDKKNDADNNLL